MIRKSAIILLAIFTVPTAIAARAGMINANEPIICTTLDVHECGPGERCVTRVPEDASVPRFFRIDFAKKTIKVTRDDGTSLYTKIATQSMLDDKIVLQGTESGLGWSMAIMSESGKMSLVAADSSAAWSFSVPVPPFNFTYQADLAG